ncbi:MAG: ABC transporter permease subunit [Anaerolineae bacterium]|nr:ABC transporter permease subunit [Anaerolineae bacterium]
MASLASSQAAAPATIRYERRKIEWFGWLMLLFLAFWILWPIVTVILWAFATQWRGGLIPQEFGLRYWAETFARADVRRALPQTIYISLTVTALSIAICLPASYAFARMDFFGKRVFLLSFLITNAFPRFSLYVAMAIIFLQLNLVGTAAGVILIQLVNTLLLMIWIPTAAFQGVDRSLEEAALDAGASRFRVFLRITIPLVFPAIASAVMLTFVGTFYESVAVILIGAPNVVTLPVIMYPLINNTLVNQYGAILSVVMWVPSLVLLVFARRFVRGGHLTAGFGV